MYTRLSPGQENGPPDGRAGPAEVLDVFAFFAAFPFHGADPLSRCPWRLFCHDGSGMERNEGTRPAVGDRLAKFRRGGRGWPGLAAPEWPTFRALASRFAALKYL